MSLSAADYCDALKMELEANKWLVSQLLKRLEALIEADTVGAEKAIDIRRDIKGITLLPALGQIYLLRHQPVADGPVDLDKIKELTKQCGAPLSNVGFFYQTYGGQRLPFSFIVSFLRASTGISDSSARSVVHSLGLLGYVSFVASEDGDRARAIDLSNDELFKMIEKSMLMKLEVTDD